MAGVAEAMAASSILLDTGSVASSTMDDEARRKKFRVSRTCICRMGSACPRMSSAFALAKDPRGDFVVLPSSETELRAAFYRYLRPKNQGSGAVVPNLNDTSILELDHGAHMHDGDGRGYDVRDESRVLVQDRRTYSESETDSSSHSSEYSRSRSGSEDYSTDSKESSDSHNSQRSYESDSSGRSRRSNESDRSGDSRRSYDSRGSFDSKRSYDSQGSGVSHASEGTRCRADSRGSCDDVTLDGGEPTLGSSGQNQGLSAVKAESSHGDPGAETTNDKIDDLSEISHDDGLEEYVAAHHFHPKVIDRFFDICLERRPEDDLIPLFITTMTSEERRSCEIPSEFDDYDEVVIQDHGRFWVVPSYPLERAHEDWRNLMRSRLRGQNLNADAMKRMSVSVQQLQATSKGSNANSSLSKWEMACALAQQVIDQETPFEGGHPQGSGVDEEKSMLDLPIKLPHQEPKPALQETGMLSYLLSSSLTPKTLSAPAKKTYISTADEDHTRRDIANAILKVSGVCGVSDSDVGDSGDDESDSQRSSETKSECTPTPSQLSMHQTMGHGKKKNGAATNPDLLSDYSVRAVKDKGRCSKVAFLRYFIMLLLMTMAVLQSSCVLTANDDGLLCSSQACAQGAKTTAVLKIAQHVTVPLAPGVRAPLEMAISVAQATTGKVYAAVDLAAEILAATYEMAVTASKATTSGVASSLSYMMTTPLKHQLVGLKTWLQEAPLRLHLALESLVEE